MSKTTQHTNRAEAPNFPIQREANQSKRNKKIGRAILGGIVAVGILAGISAFQNKQDHDAHVKHAKIEQEVLDNLNHGEDVALNQVAVLFEGAAVRKTPTPGDEVAFNVKKGEVLRIDRPRYIQDGEQEWLSFTDYEKGNPDGGAQTPQRTYWVDLTSMRNAKNMHLIEMYNYPEKSFATETPNQLAVTINSHNQAITAIGKTDLPVGQVSTLPVSSFEQLVSAESLKPAA